MVCTKNDTCSSNVSARQWSKAQTILFLVSDAIVPYDACKKEKDKIGDDKHWIKNNQFRHSFNRKQPSDVRVFEVESQQKFLECKSFTFDAKKSTNKPQDFSFTFWAPSTELLP